VLTALHKMQNGRASGNSEFSSEFLRYAKAPREEAADDGTPPPHLLAGPLAQLLNTACHTGCIPEAWTTSLITPLLKKGDPFDTANYRPVAVGAPMVRLYAAVLNARLMDFLEEGRLRAPTQAGFRPQLSIKHHLFALQHIIDRRIHRAARRSPSTAASWISQPPTTASSAR